MKLNLLQFVVFSFMVGYVGSDIFGFSHETAILMGCQAALIGAYLNNAHRIIWQKLKQITLHAH